MEVGAEAEEIKGPPIRPRAYLRNKQKPMGRQQGPGPGPCASGWLAVVRMGDGDGASLGIELCYSSPLLSIPRSTLRFLSLSHSASLMVVLIGPGGVFSLPQRRRDIEILGPQNTRSTQSFNAQSTTGTAA